MSKPKVTAAEFVARLHASTDTLYADNDKVAFQARQEALWGEIHKSPRMRDAVLAQLRVAMYGQA
jgi:hypothetical protein